MSARMPATVGRRIADLGLAINGFAMRYYTNPAFKLGAFTNPDPAVRREAIDLTKRGIDAARAMGRDLMTLWLGQDGFDYDFQAGLRAGLGMGDRRHPRGRRARSRLHDQHRIQAERAARLQPAAGCRARRCWRSRRPARPISASRSTSPMSLYADEQPAFAAALIASPQPAARRPSQRRLRQARRRPDGRLRCIVQATLELLRQIRRDGYDGALYFDTFPDVDRPRSGGRMRGQHRDRAPAAGRRRRLEGDNQLGDAIARQDAVASQAIVNAALVRQRLTRDRAAGPWPQDTDNTNQWEESNGIFREDARGRLRLSAPGWNRVRAGTEAAELGHRDGSRRLVRTADEVRRCSEAAPPARRSAASRRP